MERIEPEFRDRVPRIERREDGSEWIVSEGMRPLQVKRGPKVATVQDQQEFEKPEHNRHAPARMDPEDLLRTTPYNGESMTYTIPQGDQKCDTFRYVTIYCDFFPQPYAYAWRLS